MCTGLRVQQVVLSDIANVDDGFGGQQTEVSRYLAAEAAGAASRFQVLEQLTGQLIQCRVILVPPGAALQPLTATLQGRDVGQRQLSVDRFDISKRINLT